MLLKTQDIPAEVCKNNLFVLKRRAAFSIEG